MHFMGNTFIILLTLATTISTIECLLPQCPTNATSCCQCVTVPGCTWIASNPFGFDDSGNSSQPRCVQDSDLINVINDLRIGINRPFNAHRKRYIRPETANLEMSVGLRKEIPINMMAKTRRVRLLIVGPADAPEFSIEKGDELSCTRRFRVRERRQGPRQKKLIVDCHVSAAGGVQRLKLVVDMNKCFKSRREIRVNVRERGSKKFKLNIKSSCSCPCQSTEDEGVEQEDGIEVCEQGESFTKHCTSEADENENTNVCQNVNQYCNREQNERACSGRGTCICGQCTCDYVSQGHGYNVGRDEFTMMLGDHSGRTMQRYSGRHCECDDTSCPIFNNQMCGGVERGTCQCGQCVCHEGFRGEECDESVNTDTCTGFNGLICGGNGDCINGQCLCEGQYMGQYCEDCPTCPSICHVIEPCVMCYAFDQLDTNNNQVNCSSACGSISATVHSVDDWPGTAELCATIRQGCNYEYAYSRENNELDVYYLTNTVNCAEEQL